jgi:ketosteroid isomerase-like protein
MLHATHDDPPATPRRALVHEDAAAARFLERFFRFGAAPSVATYMPLFHRATTLFDDGMERPIGYDEIPASIEATLALAQGFRMVPERWRVRGTAVFVEARNEATILGAPSAWRSVYRIDLDGDLVRRGRRYYDRAPLLAALDPSLPRLPTLVDEGAWQDPPVEPCLAAGLDAPGLVAACERAIRDGACDALAAWFRDDAVLVAPGAPRPLPRAGVASYLRGFGGLLRGAVPELRAWAGDDALVLLEWEARIPCAARSYPLGLVDRFDLVDGRISSARRYLDAASLARALAGA